MVWKNSEQPAHPYAQDLGDNTRTTHDHFGLTKREYAAIHIAAGLSASPDFCNNSFADVARTAVKQADALFVELNK